jgi:hypothetical protein
MIFDGPYAETKEALLGFYILKRILFSDTTATPASAAGDPPVTSSEDQSETRSAAGC